MRILAALLALSMFFSTMSFGQEKEVRRSETVKILKLLRDPYMIKRIEGIRMVGKINEKEIIKEFKLIERLLDIARSRRFAKMERSEALKALQSLSERQMADPIELIKNLGRLINNRDADVEVRLDALHLLASLGRVKAKNETGKEFIMDVARNIKGIGDNVRNPRPIRASAYRVFGSLARGGADDALITILFREKDLVMREAVMDGLRNYIIERTTSSQKILEAIIRFTVKLDKAEERDLRVSGLETIQELLGNRSPLVSQKALLKFLGERIVNGDDEEMIIASQCLLRLEDEDPTPILLKELENMRRGVEARISLVMGVIEMFNRLGQDLSDTDASRIDRQKAQESVQKIISIVLIPLVGYEKAHVSVRRIAIMGLGAIPRSFSRKEAAFALIKLGLGDKNKEITDESESSLMQIARLEKTLRTPEDKIDTAAWMAWYNRNMKYLEENLVPWDKEYKDNEKY